MIVVSSIFLYQTWDSIVQKSTKIDTQPVRDNQDHPYLPHGNLRHVIRISSDRLLSNAKLE